MGFNINALYVAQEANPQPIEDDGGAVYPSFKAQHGREPVAGEDFDPDAPLCQDDAEYLFGFGRYSDLA